ncbi:MAG: DNA primase [Candidatus Krumholzibacteriota bacterium]|nr:DNA primase [Candidatus Krumholzibacteriota bacterium]
MIPEKIIDEIREQTDIVEVIGSVLDMKRAGSNYKALCPFHSEKTPSFMISPGKQIYHCFGCGKGGNAFNFLMEYEGVSFVEAARKLAAGLGIEVDKYISSGEDREKLDPYYRAMEFARDFYREELLSSREAAQAREYLDKRGFDNDLAEFFKLGFAPPSWDRFYRAASEKGISRDLLLELKLVMRSRGGSGYRDYFRNRVIFPISTISNRTVGLAGRVLDNSEPKYLNSTESPIYSKGRILYGLNYAIDDVRKRKSLVLVEGYADYLMLWKNGIHNISAVCGTSLTEQQVRLLARYAKRVYIINDGDRAGRMASVRAADQLLVDGLDIRIVTLPESEDPDSYVRKNGADALTKMMQSAPDYFGYMKLEAEKGPRASYRKGKIVKHILEAVSRVREPVDRDLMLQEVSDLFSIPADTLRKAVKQRPGKFSRENQLRLPASTKREKIQKELFRIGLESKSYSRGILENLLEDDFEGELFRKYYKELDLALKNNIDIKSHDFTGAIKDPELSRLASEIALLDLSPGPLDEVFEDTLIWIKKAALRGEMNEMKQRILQLQEPEKSLDSMEKTEIAEAYRKITREYKKLGLKGENESDEEQ